MLALSLAASFCLHAFENLGGEKRGGLEGEAAAEAPQTSCMSIRFLKSLHRDKYFKSQMAPGTVARRIRNWDGDDHIGLSPQNGGQAGRHFPAFSPRDQVAGKAEEKAQGRPAGPWGSERFKGGQSIGAPPTWH